MIAGAHTDSPCLRVKPIASVVKGPFQSLGVECYGGALWYTWFDRDLSLAGRALVASEDEKEFKSVLVDLKRPILRIPSLAIHFNRAVDVEVRLRSVLLILLCSFFSLSLCRAGLPTEQGESSVPHLGHSRQSRAPAASHAAVRCCCRAEGRPCCSQRAAEAPPSRDAGSRVGSALS